MGAFFWDTLYMYIYNIIHVFYLFTDISFCVVIFSGGQSRININIGLTYYRKCGA